MALHKRNLLVPQALCGERSAGFSPLSITLRTLVNIQPLFDRILKRGERPRAGEYEQRRFAVGLVVAFQRSRRRRWWSVKRNGRGRQSTWPSQNHVALNPFLVKPISKQPSCIIMVTVICVNFFFDTSPCRFGVGIFSIPIMVFSILRNSSSSCPADS